MSRCYNGRMKMSRDRIRARRCGLRRGRRRRRTSRRARRARAARPGAPTVKRWAAAAAKPAAPSTSPRSCTPARAFRLSYDEASARYKKGERCGGGDAPDQVLGQPDQRNEMQMGRDKVVTYGFRFPQGTLLIRCRADHVEVTRTLK